MDGSSNDDLSWAEPITQAIVKGVSKEVEGRWASQFRDVEVDEKPDDIGKRKIGKELGKCREAVV